MNSFWSNLKSNSPRLMLEVFLERGAWWIIIIQMPIYIAQKDVAGGLGLEQWQKGLIFFFWALTQNLTPFFFGHLPDKWGYKKSISISLLISIASLIFIAFVEDAFLFTILICLFGAAYGFFRLALQSQISQHNNGSTTWSLYIFLANIAAFAFTPITKYARQTDWSLVFLIPAAIYIIIYFLNAFSIKQLKSNLLEVSTLEVVNPRKLIIYSIFLSTFTIVYMQFYETLPNYYFDWADSSFLTKITPQFMHSSGAFSLEWLYTINSLLVLILVIPAEKLLVNWRTEKTMGLGILLCGIGLFTTGFADLGYPLVLGIIVYTLGELISLPTLTKIFEQLRVNHNISNLLKFQYLSWAIGLSLGGLIGGLLYQFLATKSSNPNYPILLWLPFLILSLFGSIYFFTRKK